MIDEILLQSQRVPAFRGVLDFCSNFYPCNVFGFPSVEHAFVAAKTMDYNEREYIKTLSTGQAKRYGRTLKPRPGWEQMRVYIMYVLVAEKFLNRDLAKKLLATQDVELVEYNHWGDTFWGVCNGVGENMLGKILMETREHIRGKGRNNET